MIKPAILSLLMGISTALAAGFQDPTRPDTFEGTVRSSQQHTLSAIITNHSRRLAMINGRIVREGELIGDSRVVSIGESAVQLDTPAGKVSLSIQSTEIKNVADKPIAIDKQGQDQ